MIRGEGLGRASAAARASHPAELLARARSSGEASIRTRDGCVEARAIDSRETRARARERDRAGEGSRGNRAGALGQIGARDGASRAWTDEIAIGAVEDRFIKVFT